MKTDKLELKYLALYFPYKLNVMYCEEICLLHALLGFSGVGLMDNNDDPLDGGIQCDIEDVKPILHPLSDLTKEIEHNGEKFVPMEIFEKMCSKHELETEYSWMFDPSEVWEIGDFEEMAYKFIQKLFEWHFDIHGLIEKGLAIDVNTLSENPYK